MADKVLDLKGLKCPQPQLKMTAEVFKMQPGQTLEAVADCDTFENDVRSWCERTKKTLLWFKQEGTAKRCQVRV